MTINRTVGRSSEANGAIQKSKAFSRPYSIKKDALPGEQDGAH